MVRNEMFADTWLDARPRPGSEEPELGLRSPPRPPDPLLDTESAGWSGLSSPPDPEPSRAPTTSAALPVGSLFYLALIGLIAAATIGIFFGAGFLLLVHAGKESIADTGTGDRPRPYNDGRTSRSQRSAGPTRIGGAGFDCCSRPSGLCPCTTCGNG